MKTKALRLGIGASLVVVLVMSACSSPTGPSGPKLHNARSLTELANQIKSEYNYSITDAALYDHGFSEFSGALEVFKSDDPLQGTWTSRPDLSYPAENGRFSMGLRDPSRKVSFSGLDLQNRAVSQGQYQAFWGVRDFNPRSSTTIPFSRVLVVVEGIVSLDGVDLYRELKLMYGDIVAEPVQWGGIRVTPTSFAIHGAYTQLNVETIAKTDPRVPCPFQCQLNYQAVWLKQ